MLSYVISRLFIIAGMRMGGRESGVMAVQLQRTLVIVLLLYLTSSPCLCSQHTHTHTHTTNTKSNIKVDVGMMEENSTADEPTVPFTPQSTWPRNTSFFFPHQCPTAERQV
jgi:hypothetical protein